MSMYKQAMVRGFTDELLKIAHSRGIYGLEKFASDPELLMELLKQAGLFDRAGKAVRKGVQAVGRKAKSGPGQRLQGTFGDGGAILELTTFSDVLDAGCEPHKLPAVVAGSWVYGTFSTWIGNVDKNPAWDLLCNAQTNLRYGSEQWSAGW